MSQNAPGTPQGFLTAARVEAEIKKAKKTPPAKRLSFADGKVEGLALRITPSAHASWSVEYTRPGSKRETGPKPKTARVRYTLGDADGPEAITLEDARIEAAEIRARARKGEDPHFDEKEAERRAAEAVLQERQEAQKAKAGTVAELAQQWLDSRETKAWRPASRASITSLLNRHVVPSIGRIPAAEVTRADIRALLDRVHDRTAIGSNRAFEVVRAMYNWARSRDLLTDSPCDGVKKIEKERQRERTFSDEQLRAVIALVKSTELEDLTAFLLRTGTRSHEARAARWEEIDFDRRVWTIPAENAKAGRKHEVPLAPGAWKIVERRFKAHGTSKPFVFPGATEKCNVCAQKGHAGAPLNRKVRALSITAGFLKNVGTDDKPEWEGEPIRLHDLRRTVADRMLNVVGIAPYVVDLGVLAHAPSKLVAAYMPSGVGLPEVAAALAAWDAHLDQILAGPAKRKRASVTAISKGRKRA